MSDGINGQRMNGANGIDPEWLSNTIGSIYDCVLQPAGWHDVLGVIAQGFGFSSGMLGLLQLREFTHEVKVHYRMDDEWIAMGPAYLEDSVNLWGGPLRTQNYPLDEPIVASVVRPAEEWKDFRYWREMLEPRGMIDAVVMGQAREQHLVGYLALNRHVSDGPIQGVDIEGLRLIAPHLRRAVTISNLFDLKAVEIASFRSVLDSMSCAVMLVDGDLQVVHANQKADALCAAGDVIQVAQGRLKVRGKDADRALTSAVWHATVNEAAMARRGIGVPTTTADGSAVILHMLPLGRGDLRPRLMQRAVAAIFVVDAAAPAPVDAIAALYELTPAEALIFASLCQGKSLETTAQTLGIAKSTVRTHLLHVFGKTGCKRQAELVTLASRHSLNF